MKKIALIGTHGTGKTTLAHELTAEAKKRGINAEFLGEVVRHCPLPINENQTRESSEWIIYSQYIKEIEFKEKCDLLICDRSVLDGYVYFYSLYERDPLLERFVKEKSRTYTHLIKIPMNEQRLISDGIRSNNPEFQRRIDKTFDNILRELNIPFIEYKDKEQLLKLL